MKYFVLYVLKIAATERNFEIMSDNFVEKIHVDVPCRQKYTSQLLIYNFY
jgi:hypothetical protein